MIQIRPDQMTAFDAALPEILILEFARRLRDLYPDRTDEVGAVKLRTIIDDGFADAKTLEIEIGEDVFRLIHLQFLKDFDLYEPKTQSGVIRVLNNTSVSGTSRLDFIYRHIVPRGQSTGG